ncbi:MAG: copper homeostasis protein CutC [Limisphaerales bacterium]|jgi:copper homeostasis protein
MRVEICVDSVEGALAAQKGGAQRVELCDNLMEGGTTPSLGMIRVLRPQLQIGLHVMIRPRGGDFLYSQSEYEVMQEDIRIAKEAKADGVVFGLLLPDGSIDLQRTRELIALARPLQVTFHRAFDMCREPREALDQLIAAGVDRLLTSGLEASCLEGAPMLAELQQRAANRIIIAAGGGITPRNVKRIVEATGVEEVHLSARKSRESGMTFRNNSCFMGGTLRPPEFGLKITDANTVHDVLEQFS